MKLFALITAGLMVVGGGAYYTHHSDTCPLNGSCPVAKSGGCCSTGEVLSDCEMPTSTAETTSECSAICEACCMNGAQLTFVKISPKMTYSGSEANCLLGLAWCLDVQKFVLKTNAAISGTSPK